MPDDVNERLRAFRQLLSDSGELEAEQALVLSASERFANFIMKKALIPVNSALCGFLDIYVQNLHHSDFDEEEISNIRRQIELPLGIVSQAINRILARNQMDEDPSTLIEIDLIIDKLKSLKHSGERLRQLMEVIEQFNDSDFQDNDNTYAV